MDRAHSNDTGSGQSRGQQSCHGNMLSFGWGLGVSKASFSPGQETHQEKICVPRAYSSPAGRGQARAVPHVLQTFSPWREWPGESNSLENSYWPALDCEGGNQLPNHGRTLTSAVLGVSPLLAKVGVK